MAVYPVAYRAGSARALVPGYQRHMAWRTTPIPLPANTDLLRPAVWRLGGRVAYRLIPYVGWALTAAELFYLLHEFWPSAQSGPNLDGWVRTQKCSPTASGTRYFYARHNTCNAILLAKANQATFEAPNRDAQLYPSTGWATVGEWSDYIDPHPVFGASYLQHFYKAEWTRKPGVVEEFWISTQPTPNLLPYADPFPYPVRQPAQPARVAPPSTMPRPKTPTPPVYVPSPRLPPELAPPTATARVPRTGRVPRWRFNPQPNRAPRQQRNPKPPRPGTKERKLTIRTVGGLAWLFVDQAWGVVEFIENVHKALPEEYQAPPFKSDGSRSTPYDKADALWRHFDKLNWQEVVEEMLNDVIEDFLIGHIGQAGGRVNRMTGQATGAGRATRNPYGGPEEGNMPIPELDWDPSTGWVLTWG